MKKIIVIVLITGILTGFSKQLFGQSNQDGSMPQYLYEDFGKSTVLMKNGQVQTPQMNYNMITGMMVFFRADKYYDLMNPEMVDTVFLNDSRFIPVGKAFYEVIVSGPVSFFIQHKGSLLPAGKEVGYGGTSQVASTDQISNITLSSGQYNLRLPPAYIVRVAPVFWIRRDNEMSSFETEKQFLKIFPGQEEQIKTFMKENKLRVSRPADLATIIKHLNC